MASNSQTDLFEQDSPSLRERKNCSATPQQLLFSTFSSSGNEGRIKEEAISFQQESVFSGAAFDAPVLFPTSSSPAFFFLFYFLYFAVCSFYLCYCLIKLLFSGPRWNKCRSLRKVFWDSKITSTSVRFFCLKGGCETRILCLTSSNSASTIHDVALNVTTIRKATRRIASNAALFSPFLSRTQHIVSQ